MKSDDFVDEFPPQSREVGILYSTYANENANAEVVNFDGRLLGTLGRSLSSLSTEKYEIFENPQGNYYVYLHRIKDARRFTGEFLEIDGRHEFELRELQEEYPEIARAINLPKFNTL